MNNTWIKRFVLVFIGLSAAIQFTFVGTIFGSDLELIVFLPILLMNGRGKILINEGLPFLLLIGAWLFGAVVTDLARQTPQADYLRGWARIIFFMISFSSILMLTRARIQELVWLFSGLAVSQIISARFFPNSFQSGEPWKFGYAFPIASLVCIIASYPKSIKMPSLARWVPILATAAVNIWLNYRSMFAILSGVAGITALSVFIERLTNRRLGKGFSVVIMAIFIAGGIGLTSGYGALAKSGLLGRSALQKYEVQSQGDLGIILGGRAESLVSVQAIKDSPIIGHGSWAKDRYYVALQILLLRERGFVSDNAYFEPELIPTHSYFFGSWVESGILGGIIWIYCLFRAINAAITLPTLRSTFVPFYSFLMIELIWNILFSPFGADVRFYVSGQLCAIISLMPYRGPNSVRTPWHRSMRTSRSQSEVRA